MRKTHLHCTKAGIDSAVCLGLCLLGLKRCVWVCCNAQPQAVMWPWHQKRMAVARNDFFQFGRGECLALGGAPHYALCLNGDLEFGSSGESDTFGSPCLAGSEDFEIGRLELWGLV